MVDVRKKVAILGSGNIGTDLMIKLTKSRKLNAVAMAGIDPRSDGLACASRLGLATTVEGVRGLSALPEFQGVELVFDATSAAAHREHHPILSPLRVRIVDLTPAAIGPRVVPVVNLEAHRQARAVNMVTCGGQATIPVVAAVSRVTKVHYAEVVCSIASKSAGPGTRANIDEFTETTARALSDLGGAERSKAIIVLNPAEPPLLMRNTIFCLVDAAADREAIRESVTDMARRVCTYVPGYRLKQAVQFDVLTERDTGRDEELSANTLKVSIFLEVSGAGHYLPTYAGNLDIMTSAAIATAEMLLT